MKGDYLLDTNIISEENKSRPNPGVMRWLKYADHGRVWLSVVVLGEARRWMESRPEGREKRAMRAWLDKWENWPSERVLPVTPAIVQRWGEITVRGQRVHDADMLIAATGLVHRMTVVTHNIKNFRGIPGLEIADPWED